MPENQPFSSVPGYGTLIFKVIAGLCLVKLMVHTVFMIQNI